MRRLAEMTGRQRTSLERRTRVLDVKTHCSVTGTAASSISCSLLTRPPNGPRCSSRAWPRFMCPARLHSLGKGHSPRCSGRREHGCQGAKSKHTAMGRAGQFLTVGFLLAWLSSFGGQGKAGSYHAGKAQLRCSEH